MRSFFFLFREFVESLRHSRFLHLTYGAQVTISLLVLGIFFVLLVGGAIAWKKLGDQLEIHVFLKDDLSAKQINAMEQDIGNMEFVRNVKFRSKDEALAIFSARSSTLELNDLLENNPLPASFVIQATDPEHIQDVVAQCEKLTGTLATRYGSQVVEKYLKILMILVIVCLITISLLVLFTYSSINNIIALSVYARRTEIRIMQLVGATWWFIRWPFIFEGIFFGFLGASIAYLIIFALLVSMKQALALTDLAQAMPSLGVDESYLFLALAVLLVGLGVLVGFFGSLKTVNNFLSRELELQLESIRVRKQLK
ncbi:MAG: permease-like cell division protein FtsX [bacterium]